MIKDFILVGLGSFLGGGTRLIVSRIIQTYTTTSVPLATFTVNILGCLLIGFFSSLNYSSASLSPQTRLILTTGFCGGFTTFSTFISESSNLIKTGNTTLTALYIIASIAIGFIALVAGIHIAKAIS